MGGILAEFPCVGDLVCLYVVHMLVVTLFCRIGGNRAQFGNG